MNSAKTQITRKTTSAPMRWIVNNFYFSPFDPVLHFGEGKAFQDTELLRHPPYGSGPEVVAFDPNSPDEWKRDRAILDQEYFVGVSVYVFNTLTHFDRRAAYLDMLGCCEHLLIAVRTDKVNGIPHADGVITSRNTFQTQLGAGQWYDWFRQHSPERTSVTLLHKTSAYVILDIKR